MYHLLRPRTLIVRQLLMGSLSLAIVATPSMTQACWLTNWFRPKPQTTYYQPQFASAAPASTCTTTCTKRVCNYIPQTAYRTVYTNVPVTSYRPVTTADPCSGCRTTCWRPVTSYVRQARRVPYTTYRQVCQNVVMRPVVTAMPSCNSGCNAGYRTSATPGCPSGTCGGAFAPPQSLPQGLSAPSLLRGAGYPPASSAAPIQTFSNPPSREAAKQHSVEKKADPEPSKGPDLNAKPTFAPPSQPTWKHRTASVPKHRTWSYTTVSWPVQPVSHTNDALSNPSLLPVTSKTHHTDLDDSGWVSVGQ